MEPRIFIVENGADERDNIIVERCFNGATNFHRGEPPSREWSKLRQLRAYFTSALAEKLAAGGQFIR